jgi:hypothetical protein
MMGALPEQQCDKEKEEDDKSRFRIRRDNAPTEGYKNSA